MLEQNASSDERKTDVNRTQTRRERNTNQKQFLIGYFLAVLYLCS